MSTEFEFPTELDRLAEEFVERERRGERPTLDEYIARHPELEQGIREIFPLLAAIEGAKDASGTDTRHAATCDLGLDDRTLGGYRLLREVGRGGMGVVYEAQQEVLGRRVALKVLPPHAMRDERFVERFRIEAQAAARLQHPHIVPVIGLGEDGGVHYYTMQFVDGYGLDEILEESQALLAGESDSGTRSAAAARLFTTELSDASTSGSAPSPDDDAEPHRLPARVEPFNRASRRRYRRNVARIGLHVAEALAHAHAHGVLHRDVKPSNVMLDRRGHAWVADFGLCREDDAAGVTRTGDLVGTLRYMAPECFRGEHDVRGDIYGLGLTLYELLAMGPAFEVTSRAALVGQITGGGPARLAARDATIPRDLTTIVQSAIAPDPELRYPTADALAADLRAFLDGRPVAARAPSLTYVLRATVRRHRPLFTTLVLAALALVAGSVLYVRGLKQQESLARIRHYGASVAATESALRDGDLPRARKLLAQAPDEFRDWEWRHLSSRLQQGIRSFPSLSPDIAIDVTHSPDGHWVAVGGKREIHVFDDARGTVVKKLPCIYPTRALAWSPDASRLVAGGLSGLTMWSWPGGEVLVELAWPDWINGVCFDAERNRLLVGDESCRVHVLDPETLATIEHVELPSKIMSIALSSDGRHLAVGRLDGRVSLLDASSLEVRWTRPAGPRAILGVTFAGNDRVASTAYDGAVPVFDVADGARLHVLPHTGDTFDVATSVDGAALAVLQRGGFLHVWDPRSGRRKFEPRSLGRNGAAVSFHPDGMRVVTSSWAGTVTEWDASADRDAHVLGGHVDGVSALAAHPGGQWVASGGVTGLLRLWDLDTGELVRVWPGHGGWVSSAAFSPDGRLVASGDNARVGTILVRSVPDGEIVHRLEGHERTISDLMWTPDGRQLLSIGFDGLLCVWDAGTGTREQRIALSDAALRSLDVRHDGSLVAIGGGDAKIRLVDPKTWAVRATLAGHEGPLWSVAFHPDGEVLASVSEDRTVRLWNTRRAEILDVLDESTPDLGDHTDVIECVVFHPEGRRLLTGSRDASIAVWDWANGQRLATLRGHRGWVHELAFTPNGERLISSASDRTVRVWDTETAAQMAPRLQEARRRRDAATPLVDARLADLGRVDRVVHALETDSALEAQTREAALRVAHARWATREHLGAWLWHLLTDPQGDPRAWAVAGAVSRGFARAADFRGLQDGEGYLLTGVSSYRVGHKKAPYYLARSITLNQGAVDLQATAMACLVLWHGEHGEPKDAEAWTRQLGALLEEHPEARSPRVETFVAEVRDAR